MTRPTKRPHNVDDEGNYFHRFMQSFQHFPPHLQILLLLSVLALAGIIATNHVAMIDVINLLLIVKGFFTP